MLEVLTPLLLLLPFAAAALSCVNLAPRQPLGERGVRGLALGAMALSLSLSIAVFAKVAGHPDAFRVVIGPWLSSGDYVVNAELLVDPLSAAMAILISGLGLVIAKFSSSYMHRESGFTRFYAVLCLFIGEMLLLVLGGNLVITFVGWEGAGLTSYLLIGFFYERRAPASAATRAFVMSRVGDAGFITAIALAFAHFGAVDYWTIAARVGAAPPSVSAAIALGLLLAAAVKTAQLPFNSWLARAMEGPTPSSALFYGALMVSAGVYLLLRVHPVLDAAPAVRALAVLLGVATALYGGAVSLVQTDAKSVLIFSTTGQLGLMVAACGFGAYKIAIVHLFTHALFRCFQFLRAPSVLVTVPRERPARAPMPALLFRLRALYAALLHRLWLDEAIARWVTAPILRVARHLDQIDRDIIERATGTPPLPSRVPAAALAWDEQILADETSAALASESAPAPMAAPLARDLDASGVHRLALSGSRDGRELPRGTGVVGVLLEWASALSHAVERFVVASAIGRGVPAIGGIIGRALGHVEDLLERPIVAGVLMLALVIAVLRGVL
jgi:formate hydrogenlyase subunit 3/multisubunit Na+/H+ antiporter MnhD subunit